jgi:hypothetical protein
LLRLFDEADGRAAPDFEASWRSFLQAWNLVQFHDGIRVMSSECPPDVYEEVFARVEDRLAADAPPTVIASRGSGGQEDFDSLLELATEISRPLIMALRDRRLPTPVFDFELPADPGRCGPQADLAWPDLLMVVLGEHQAQDQGAFEKAGFSVRVHPVDVSAFMDEMARRMDRVQSARNEDEESR